MSNTFKKTSLRGFTLIELLVVIAIIGLLSTAIMGPVQTGLKKGRDTRKISDLTQIQGALLQYAGDNNGEYPDYLPGLVPTYMSFDVKMASTTNPVSSAARDRFVYVVYTDSAGNRISYHLGVSLENQNASLQGDADCGTLTEGTVPTVVPPLTLWGGMTGNPIDGNHTSCTTAVGGALYAENWAGIGNPKATAPTTDFGGKGSKENANDVCSSDLTTCIFDIQPK